jgi:hypothetical protein
MAVGIGTINSGDREKPGAELLAHLGLALPTSPKIIQNVVEKIA